MMLGLKINLARVYLEVFKAILVGLLMNVASNKNASNCSFYGLAQFVT